MGELPKSPIECADLRFAFSEGLPKDALMPALLQDIYVELPAAMQTRIVRSVEELAPLIKSAKVGCGRLVKSATVQSKLAQDAFQGTKGALKTKKPKAGKRPRANSVKPLTGITQAQWAREEEHRSKQAERQDRKRAVRAYSRARMLAIIEREYFEWASCGSDPSARDWLNEGRLNALKAHFDHVATPLADEGVVEEGVAPQK